jgi:hypothetical protein
MCPNLNCISIIMSFLTYIMGFFMHFGLLPIMQMEGGAVGHIFERDPPRDHPCQVWFKLVQRFQRRRFKCDLLSKYA